MRAELRRPSRLTAIALLSALAWPALAQPKDPGENTTTTYTPVTGSAAPLFPRVDTDETNVFQLGAYAANSEVAQVVVEVARDAIPADGQSATEVTVRLFDKAGKPLAGSAFVTIETSGGRLLLPAAATDELGPRGRDTDRAIPGTQLKVKAGVARFSLLAPYEPQDVRLRVSAGDVAATGLISYVPELRQMVATGLLEGIINFRDKSPALVGRSGDGFEREIRRWENEFNNGKANVAGRAAVFVKGMIRGDVLLTAAYDSDKDTRQRLLRDVQPEEFYPVYGDSSLRGFDARSTERLYVRLDKGKHYLLWGDFQTGDGFSQTSGGGAVASLQQRSLGAYNRTASGLRAHYEEGKVVGNVFALHDTLKQVVEEFASQGSGPYGLSNDAVLEGSEKVEVVVRDRNQPSRIIKVTPLQRLVDYSFEPFSGRILLATFLPSVDSDLNPVSLRVSYEVDQGGPTFWAGGADAQWRIGERLEIGGAVVQDDNPIAPYELVSANASVRFGPNTMMVVEGARSNTDINTRVNQLPGPGDAVGNVAGRAARAEFVHTGKRSDLHVSWGRSGRTFVNPSAPLAGGRDELQATASYKVSEESKLYAEALRSEDRNPGGGNRRALRAGATTELSERLTLDLSLRAIRESAGTIGPGLTTSPFGSTSGLTGSIATGSGGGAVGFGNQLIDTATGLPIINSGSTIATTNGVANTTALSGTSVVFGLGYRATDQLSVGAELEHDVEGAARRRVALGGDYQVAERTRLYGRYEHQTGLSSPYAVTTDERRSNVFVAGVDTGLWKSTQLFSEYRLRDAISGRDLQLATGVRNTWDVSEGLRVAGAVERTSVMAGNVPDAAAVSLGVDYTADELWKGSTRVELRRSGDFKSGTTDNTDDSFRTFLWQVTVARKLDRDWTLLGRNYLLHTDYAARGDVVQNRAQIGVAYRDTDTNRVNALAKYEYKTEHDDSNAATGELSSRAHIVSTHADWHPSRPWWVTGRVAGKWQQDQFEGGVRDSFNAQLLSGRVVYDITENWDLGVLAAAQLGQQGARQTAYGVEAGYLVRQNLWLSAGYNRSGFDGDDDLVGYEYTQQGFYIRLRFKFDESLLCKCDKSTKHARSDEPEVNTP